uniref:Cadherin domain-containing protein n=1 Tax=Salarias fasciatus TaxID=181472 RepID=A0A672GA27_SALFA
TEGGIYWIFFHMSLLLLFGKKAFAQIRYTVPEEAKGGTVVGNVARDLGLDVTSLNDRRFRVVSGSKDAFFEVNQDNGALVVHGKIDREELCKGSGACVIDLKILITDVNDNSPWFSQNPLQVYMFENNVAGKILFSVSATDKDMNENAVISYHIVREGGPNDIMSFLNVQPENGHITAMKSFDFETVKTFQFQVVATDSGTPSLSNNVTVKLCPYFNRIQTYFDSHAHVL